MKYYELFTGDAGPFGQIKMIPTLDHIETGKKAKKLREDYYISQREVAREMGLSAMFISQLERGRCRWTEKHICNYANAVCHLVIQGKS
jgi:predicted transcriptional regulator